MEERKWPTPLGPDGTAPVLLTLLGSSDLLLARQAAYLIYAGKALKESGYEIEAFQQPLGGIAVPFVMKNKKGLPAAGYTYSEPWDAEAVKALSAWVTALRAAGVGPQVPVIVVSQTDSAEVKALESIFQFIHMPQQNLPGESHGQSQEAKAREGTPEEAKQLADRFVQLTLRRLNVQLDYSPGSLAAVDDAVDKIKATGVSEQDASGMVYSIGCYVGEVLVRHAGGEWCPTSSLGMERVCGWPIVVKLRTGAGANPIGKAFKRFRNGPGDSLAFFYQSTVSLPLS